MGQFVLSPDWEASPNSPATILNQDRTLLGRS
jgi:hypothetical protein